jgi:plastocyanin
MKQAALLFTLAALLSPQPHSFGGSVIEGTVKLLPAPSGAPAKARYQLKSGQVGKPPSSAAIVYLEGSFVATTNTMATTNRIGQKDFQFLPAVVAVQRGTTIEFPNLDEDYHNVFSYSKAKRFDLGRYRKDESPPAQRFEQPGLIKLYCEIHEHMRGNILVLDTPYFYKTDDSGRYRLENLPPGQFVLKAWLDEKNILEQPVELEDGKTYEINFGAK